MTFCIPESGEQLIGEDVEYEETHDGDMGTGSGVDVCTPSAMGCQVDWKLE